MRTSEQIEKQIIAIKRAASRISDEKQMYAVKGKIKQLEQELLKAKQYEFLAK